MYPCSTRECNDIRVRTRERALEWRTSFRIENFLDLKIIFISNVSIIFVVLNVSVIFKYRTKNFISEINTRSFAVKGFLGISRDRVIFLNLSTQYFLVCGGCLDNFNDL